MMASGMRDLRSDETGSETREGNLKVYTASKIAGWACENRRARSVGSSSMGWEGFTMMG